jgi:hypothetical protein
MGRYPRYLDHAYFKLMSQTTLSGDCWVKIRTPKGRPRVSYDHQRRLASRVVLAIHRGLDIEDTQSLVCHTCDNEKCYNPNHLYIGDKSSNARDVYKSA